MKNLFLVLPLFLFVSCATAGNKKVLNSWINRSESDLLANWGIPDKTMEKSGVTLHEYYRCGGATGYTAPYTNLTVVRNRCARWTFGIAQEKVVGARFDPR